LGLLLDTLRTGDDYLRAWAVYFLGKLGAAAETAVPALVMRLTDETENSEIRSQAARALLHIESKKPPVALLAACLDEPDLEVRCVVIELLGKCRSKAVQAAPRLAQFLTHPDQNVRRTSCDALVEIGVAALPPVLEVLRSEGTTARRWAAHALWQIGARDVAALPPIVAALADRSEVVCMETARILDLIGPSAADALRSALSSENRELRIAARRVLEAME
jgi:HEAT repeat protein